MTDVTKPNENKPEQTQPLESPNADWQNDPNLDSNGNPVAPTQEPVKDKPVEETTELPTEDKGKEETPREYNLDTPVVKQVEKLLTEAGIEVTDVAKIMSENGGKATPELVKQIADKHGDAVASIVAEHLSNFHQAGVEKSNKKDLAIYTQVEEAFKGITEQGGKETWGELAGWAKDNVPKSERVEINKMLAQGGLAAKYAIDDLVSRFKTSDSFNVQADLITGDNVVQTNGVTPLSKQDYQREFRALEAKGHVYGQSAELAALDKRRNAGMQRGL